MSTSSKRFADSWHPYLRSHSKRGTRVMHYAQTGLGGVAILACIALGAWWGLALVLGSIFVSALVAHFVIEGNSPAAFDEPFWWSVLNDMRMTVHMLTGTLSPHLKAAGVAI